MCRRRFRRCDHKTNCTRYSWRFIYSSFSYSLFIPYLVIYILNLNKNICKITNKLYINYTNTILVLLVKDK